MKKADSFPFKFNFWWTNFIIFSIISILQQLSIATSHRQIHRHLNSI